MSYDLYAIDVRPGHEPGEAFEALMDAEESDEGASWSDEQVARAERVAAALESLNPRLERFVFDHREIAETLGVSEEEARARWRHIELNTPDGDNPIQVTVDATHAALTMPYWYTGDRAQSTIREALSYLAVIERETGWTIFDPQLDRALDVSGDADAVVSMYEAGSRHVAEFAAEGPPEQKRKRRFWLF